MGVGDYTQMRLHAIMRGLAGIAGGMK
jgi:hypothetical protein